MEDGRCPLCGTKLVENRYGDLCCPNDGIIKQHKEPSNETPGYVQ